MVKKTHVQGGFLISLVTNPIVLGIMPNVSSMTYKIVLTVVYIYGAYFGSMLPDIDMKGSYISKMMPMVHKVFGKRFKHRGFTHSLLLLVIMYFAFKILSIMSQGEYAIDMFFSGILMGCISHIVLDLFTKEGVVLFYPIPKSISLTSLKTNSPKEKKLNKVLEIIIFMVLGMNFYIAMFADENSIFGLVINKNESNVVLQLHKD